MRDKGLKPIFGADVSVIFAQDSAHARRPISVRCFRNGLSLPDSGFVCPSSDGSGQGIQIPLGHEAYFTLNMRVVAFKDYLLRATGRNIAWSLEDDVSNFFEREDWDGVPKAIGDAARGVGVDVSGIDPDQLVAIFEHADGVVTLRAEFADRVATLVSGVPSGAIEKKVTGQEILRSILAQSRDPATHFQLYERTHG